MPGQAPNTPLSGQAFDPQTLTLKNTVPRIEQTFLSVGSTLGKYRIITEIARGGMAVVYRAMQLDLEREVALKVIPAAVSINPRFLERFLAEAHAASKLHHPCIVDIHEIANEQAIWFIAMDLIPGKNLFDYLHENKPKLVEVLDVVVRLADALAYAHRQRIIHRDLKLNNVIMKESGTPVLIDFGLAKALEDDRSNITRTGELVGSPAYMAPERIVGGACDHRSDICSLGIMLYEMLTFKNPYLDQRSIHQTTLNVIEASPVQPRRLVSWLPAEVEAIALKAMAADPGRRYQTMEEFRDDIVRYQRGEYVHAQPPTLTTRLKYFVRRRWPYVAMSGLALAFTAVLSMTLYSQSVRSRLHWQQLYTERFSAPDADRWTAFRGTEEDSTAWRVIDNNLVPSGTGPLWVRFEQLLTRDARVEFDIAALDHDLSNIGVFMYGSTPENAYRFYLYRGPEALHGACAPSSDLIVRDYDPMEFPAAQQHHVVIERRQRQFTMRVDDQVVARLWDFFPPLGTRNQQMGFFADGPGALFDNLRIEQLATPLAPSPTLIADRFWERGDATAALDEYRGLRLDVSDNDLAREIQLRIPDCQIRSGKPADAIAELTRAPMMRFGTESAQAEAMGLLSQAYAHAGRTASSDSTAAVIIEQFPSTPAAWTCAYRLSSRLLEQVAVGAEPEPDKHAVANMRAHERLLPLVFQVERSAAINQIQRGFHERAATLTMSMMENYQSNPSMVSQAQVLHATSLLGKMDRRQEAVDILNRCVASHSAAEGVWNAWMMLASIYDYDIAFQDAATIYRKIYRECPKGISVAWMARVHMGDVAGRANLEESAQSMFRDVVDAPHPFVLPRAIARYYLGELTETQFTDLWHSFYPEDWYFLYYMARKAVRDGERVVAEIYLQQLLQTSLPGTWRYNRIYQVLQNLSRY